MKALVISDDDNLIERLTNVLENNGYDCITYRWLLKALDNVEEIAPHLVIINAKDYPRHWKTFVQYTNGIEKISPKVILVIDKDFSLDEKKKAQALGINGMFPIECSDKDFESVLETVNFSLKKIKSISPDVKNNNNECLMMTSFIFSNPISNNLVTGKVTSYNKKTIQLIPDNMNEIKNLSENQNVPFCSLRTEDKVQSVSVIIKKMPMKIDDPIVLEIEGS